jgi:hypothetical protein
VGEERSLSVIMRRRICTGTTKQNVHKKENQDSRKGKRMTRVEIRKEKDTKRKKMKKLNQFQNQL